MFNLFKINSLFQRIKAGKKTSRRRLLKSVQLSVEELETRVVPVIGANVPAADKKRGRDSFQVDRL
jgi:hypothetical protein